MVAAVVAAEEAAEAHDAEEAVTTATHVQTATTPGGAPAIGLFLGDQVLQVGAPPVVVDVSVGFVGVVDSYKAVAGNGRIVGVSVSGSQVSLTGLTVGVTTVSRHRQELERDGAAVLPRDGHRRQRASRAFVPAGPGVDGGQSAGGCRVVLGVRGRRGLLRGDRRGPTFGTGGGVGIKGVADRSRSWRDHGERRRHESPTAWRSSRSG